jgi:lipid A ethanolaminephosphotransferase
LPHKDDALSQDDLFCTLLISFELDTKMCAVKKDMLMQNQTIKSNASSAE